MKRLNLITLFVSATLLLSSCELVAGIFEAGVWSGIILVVAVIVLLIWLVRKLGGRGRD